MRGTRREGKDRVNGRGEQRQREGERKVNKKNLNP